MNKLIFRRDIMLSFLQSKSSYLYNSFPKPLGEIILYANQVVDSPAIPQTPGTTSPDQMFRQLITPWDSPTKPRNLCPARLSSVLDNPDAIECSSLRELQEVYNWNECGRIVSRYGTWDSVMLK